MHRRISWKWNTHDVYSTTLSAICNKCVGILEMAPDILRGDIFCRDYQILELVLVKGSWVVVVVGHVENVRDSAKIFDKTTVTYHVLQSQSDIRAILPCLTEKESMGEKNLLHRKARWLGLSEETEANIWGLAWSSWTKNKKSGLCRL